MAMDASYQDYERQARQTMPFSRPPDVAGAMGLLECHLRHEEELLAQLSQLGERADALVARIFGPRPRTGRGEGLGDGQEVPSMGLTHRLDIQLAKRGRLISQLEESLVSLEQL